MNNSDSIKTKLLENWLKSGREKYTRLTENRRAIGNKAQGNITISGIFIAINFTWLKDISMAKITIGCFETLGLVIATILFLLSVLVSVFVLFIETIPMPREDDIIGEILKQNDDLTNRLHPLLYDLSEHLKIVNDDFEICNKKKSYLLFCAQAFLSIGICTIALIAISLIN
jgi:hypothetical protein